MSPLQSSGDPGITGGNTESEISHHQVADGSQRSDLRDYLDTVFGNTEGWAHMACGKNGHFSRTGSYEFDPPYPISGAFQWPAERDGLIEAVGKYACEQDVYVCPYLMRGEKRSMYEAVELRVVHADCDGSVALDKVQAINGFAVGSGSSGHAHVYVLLSQPVTLDQHEMLCRAFGKYLGDADAKIRPSDILRPPTSLNHKGRAREEESYPVEWLVRPTDVTTNPQTLAEILSVDLNQKPTTSRNRKGIGADGHDSGDPVDLTRHPKVKAAIEKETERNDGSGTDRSYDTYRIVAACKDSGLTVENAKWAVRQRGELAERVDGRNDDDVQTCWDKVDRAVFDVGPKLTLPPRFWQRPALARVQQIAYAEMASPDAVLGLILPKLSASAPPRIRIDTGVRKRRMPLNTFGALVGRTGGFKSSAADAVMESVMFTRCDMTDVLRNRLGLFSPIGEDIPYRAYPGTAQGIVENFMGDVEQPASEAHNGKPKVVRQQVRTNVLLESDEGNWLVKELADTRSKVGEILRELWTGADTGQGNAKSENRRGVRQGEYSFGMTVGFQLKVLGDLLRSEDVELGTPQRIVCFWTGAPDLPDERVAHPGDLVITIPSEPMELCVALKHRVWDELKPRLRAGGSDDDHDSQRIAVVTRLAAQMTILGGEVKVDEITQVMTVTGRSEITEEDWALAELIADTSRTIKDHAIAKRREKDATAQQIRRARNLAESIEDEESRSTPVGRAKARIVGYLTGAGLIKWTGKGAIRAKFNNDDVEHADIAMAELVESGRVIWKENGRTVFVELVS